MSIHLYDRDEKFGKDVAYGTLESTDEMLNIQLLLGYKDELIDWIDNHFTSKEDFTKLLKEKDIICYSNQ